MRYVDSGSRLASEALGTWLASVASDELKAVRLQSGYFGIDGIGVMLSSMQRVTIAGGIVRVLVGSNESGTLAADVEQMRAALSQGGSADIGVVCYRGALFHPKVYHFVRADGSSTAYVGSANLTAHGVGSFHCEAGIVLDGRLGDDQGVLEEIANAIDSWFADARAGLSIVRSDLDVAALVERGILAVTRPPRRRSQAEEGDDDSSDDAVGSEVPSLAPLFAVPKVAKAVAESGVVDAPPPLKAAAVAAGRVAVATRDGWPDYVLFDPAAEEPTNGHEALTSTPLRRGVAGLIVRLNRDSGRHFFGGGGTSNISLPVVTLATLRFGVWEGKYTRARAEFVLRQRFLGKDDIYGETSPTNIMAYGHAAGERGHADVRMVLPASTRRLRDAVLEARLNPPAVGDCAILEWPTATAPEFRISFLDPQSPLGKQVRDEYERADSRGELLSDGACWLPDGVSPPWSPRL